MYSNDDNHVSMRVWFSLLPEEDLRTIKDNEVYLEKINNAFDEWKAMMRAKPFMGTRIGVIFDRIRMLMINIGIASEQNRRVAEAVQEMLSKRLKQSAIDIINGITREIIEKKLVKEVLIEFYRSVKFTRDNDPEYEIEELIRKRTNRDDIDPIVDVAIKEGTNVIKRVYMRLLSPNPWNDA